MTIAGSIPVLACFILLCFKRDSFSVRFELFLLKTGLFFFLIPVQKLWLFVPEPFYNFVNSLFSIDRSKTGFQLTYHHIQLPLPNGYWIWIPKWFAVSFVVWSILFFFFLCFQIYHYKKSTAQLLMHSHPTSDSSKARIQVRNSRYIDTPYTFGFFRPCIILPDDIADATERDLIEQHEQFHIRHLDSFIKLFCLIAVCLHFYNPFSYLLLYLYNKLCELRCDELVIRNLPKEAKRKYGELLLAFSVRSPKQSIIWSNQFSNHDFILKWRLKNIMKKKHVTVLQKFSACLLFCILLLSSAATAVAYSPFWVNPEKEIIADGTDCTIIEGQSIDPFANLDFSISNTIFITEENSILYFDNSSKSNLSSHAACNHTFTDGTTATHKKNASGGCTVTQYQVTFCKKCGLIKSKTLLYQITYPKCSH